MKPIEELFSEQAKFISESHRDWCACIYGPEDCNCEVLGARAALREIAERVHDAGCRCELDEFGSVHSSDYVDPDCVTIRAAILAALEEK